MKKAPALRFKGFTNDWEQRKLGDYGSVAMNKRIFKNQTNTNSGVPFYKIGTFGKKADAFISKKLFEEYRKKYPYPKKGDLLISASGSIGRVIEYTGQQAYYQDSNIVWLNHNDNLENIYLKAYYQIIHWSGIEGSTIKRLYNKNILNTKIYVPIKDEQFKVGTIIDQIEKLITLQQRKLNDLSSMKSALLQNIFPNTQGIKKIKLSTQEWNLQKISSIFKERNQRNKNGMLLSVSISKGVYPFSENDRKDNSSNDKSNYKEVKINDLAYNSMRMWQGAVGVSKYNGIVSPAYTVITPKKEENPNFYYYYFKNKRMLFNFRQHSQGLTSDTWNLKFPLFEKILIQVPSDKEEEQRISSLFKQLDKSIDLNKIHIEKLTSIKQFLLQNMFI